MSTKHYPYSGGSFDRIIFDGDGSVWVPESENAKLRELVRIAIEYCVNGYCAEEDECPLYESRHSCRLQAEARELGVEL